MNDFLSCFIKCKENKSILTEIFYKCTGINKIMNKVVMIILFCNIILKFAQKRLLNVTIYL